MQLHGGCLCGDLRYSIETEGGIADYCHCVFCQRASGAPVVAWLQVPPAQFALLSGDVRRYTAAPGSHRHFCARCGGQVYMTDDEGRSVGIAIAGLDEPERVAPTAHGFAARKLTWLTLEDDLPRYPGPPPHDE